MFEKKLYANIVCSSIANLKCTPSDRQMYPCGYMYPRLGTTALGYLSALHWLEHINATSCSYYCNCVI